MTQIEPKDAREKVKSGEALLVCGYDDEAKCRQFGLEGAISYREFLGRVPSLPKDREIIFYCA